MQHTAVVGAQYDTSAPVSQGHSWLAYGRGLTFTVWLFLLVLNYWWRQDWDDRYEMAAEGVSFKQYYYYGLGLALAAYLTLGPRAWAEAAIACVRVPAGAILTFFFLLMFVLAPLSLNPQVSAMYAVGTWCILLLCYLFWTADFNVVRHVMILSGMVLFAWLLLLLLHHGLRNNTIGGINRNMIGKAALVAMACMLLSRAKMIRWAGISGALFFLVLVTSRGSLVALGTFLGAYYALQKGTGRTIALGFLGLLLLAIILLTSGGASEYVLEGVMRLNDPERGLGSGFSGRTENWANGLELFSQRPVFGYGFRAAAAGASELPRIHSGYINLLLESGVIGTLMVVGAVGVTILARLRLAIALRPLVHQNGTAPIALIDTFRVNAVVTALLCSILTIWVYEPLYINLGSVLSVSFFLVIIAPFFIGMNPPSFAGQARWPAGR